MPMRGSLTICAILASASMTLGARPAIATVLTFDDLSNPGYEGATIADGYGGLSWNNFTYLNGAAEKTYGAGVSGYSNGLVSGDDVALNTGGGLAGVTSATPFEFNGGDFTAAWNNGLKITITGYFDGAQVDQTTFTVSTHSPTLVTLGWSDLTSVTFASSGGTNAGYRGWGEEFAMDDMEFTPSQDPPPHTDPTLPAPEPAAWVMMILGAGLVGGMLRRRARPGVA